MKNYRSPSPLTKKHTAYDPFHPYMVEDLLQGDMEWRNTQDIVRISFKCLTETIKTQGQAIRELERSLSNRITFSDFHASLAQKMDFAEISESIADLRTRIEGKVSSTDVENIISMQIRDFNKELQGKCSLEYINAVASEKISNQEFRYALNALELKMKGIKEKGKGKEMEMEKENKNPSVNKSMKQEYCEDKINLLMEKVNSSIVRVESVEKTVRDSEGNYKKHSETMEKLKNDITNAMQIINTLNESRADPKDLRQMLEILAKNNNSINNPDKIFSQKQQPTDLFLSNLQDLRNSLSTMEEAVYQKIFHLEKSITNIEIDLLDSKRLPNLIEIELKSHLKSTEKQFLQELEIIKSSSDKKLEILKSYLEDLNKIKPGKEEINEALNKLNFRIQSKAEISEVDKSLHKHISDLRASFHCLQTETHHHLRQFESSLTPKPLPCDKPSPSLLKSCLKPLDPSEAFSTFPPLDSIKSRLLSLSSDLCTKASKCDLDSLACTTLSKLEAISKDLLLKGSIKDICTLLDMKANIEDINTALSDIHKELDCKSSVVSLNSYICEQQELNSMLLAANSVGRWICKSKEIEAGGAVAWDVQSINTAPDNLVWENRGNSVVVVAPGLYEVSFGFYCRKRQVVQVLVNGNMVIRTGEEGRGWKADGVTGVTLVEVLALQERSRVAISIAEERNGCEGFLSIRRIL